MHVRPLILFLLVTLSAPTPVWSAEQSGTLATLEETASEDVPADLLSVQMRVEVDGDDPSVVQATVNERIAESLSAAKQFDGLKTFTGTYSVYRTTSDPSSKAMIWRATQSLTLSGGNFAVVLKAANALQLKKLVISGITPELSEQQRSAAEDRVMIAAVGKMKHEATLLASTMGLAIDHFTTVRVNKGGGMVRRQMAPMAAMAMPAGPSAQPSDIAVSVTVSSEILLGPSH